MSKWGEMSNTLRDLHRYNKLPRTGCGSREITLRIPIELPPCAVAQIYQEARDADKWWTGNNQIRLKDPINERNCRATAYAALMAQSGRKWRDVWEEWNTITREEWRFVSAQSFMTAVGITHKRLTGRKLEWKRKRGDST